MVLIDFAMLPVMPRAGLHSNRWAMLRFPVRVRWPINVGFAHVWKSLRTLTPDTDGNTIFRYTLAQTFEQNPLQVNAFRIIKTTLFPSETPGKNSFLQGIVFQETNIRAKLAMQA
jgi:hypothetical protein